MRSAATSSIARVTSTSPTGAVPLYDSSQPQDDQAAENYLGEYAPKGVQCSVEDFLATYGGVPVSFA